MNRRLWWKLFAIVALGTLLLFWVVSFLGDTTEQRMSFIAKHHQETIKQWGKTAERLYNSGDQQALTQWLEKLQREENTWAAVVQSEIRAVPGSKLSETYVERFRLGRSVDWKIHLYFTENPTMEVTFADGNTHFLVTLPQRMRPGAYLPQAKIVLKVALPLAVLLLLCLVIYRHVMNPIRQLEVATRQFSEGNLGARVGALLGSRNDELAALANTFDRMAERIGDLILSQRRLIADLSHELRTPLTRIDMAVSCVEEGIDTRHFVPRIRRECNLMRALVEDTLTLAWLENEQPDLGNESLDLTDLVDSVADDARYEYPEHEIVVDLPAQAPLARTSNRALSQAIENVVRNACNYTPQGRGVTVKLTSEGEGYLLTVSDDGPGVPEEQLELIFKPFFRACRHRENSPSGHGLGLALARRHLEAIGGWIRARNAEEGGFIVTLWVPAPQL